RGKLSNNFFIQAEDGIRAFHVTGVQTCALPIYRPWILPRGTTALKSRGSGRSIASMSTIPPDTLTYGPKTTAGAPPKDMLGFRRSEERRVGEEVRSWGAAFDVSKQ